MPIRTFADALTADLFRGARPAAFAADVQARAQRKLQQLHVATCLADLRLPGNDLKKLHGEENRYQLRSNRKHRIRFTVECEAPLSLRDVAAGDFHDA